MLMHCCQIVVLEALIVMLLISMFRVPIGETVVSADSVKENQTVMTISGADQSRFVSSCKIIAIA